MRIGVFGSGMVGQIISAKLVELGHDVMLGTRDVAALLARTELGIGQTEPFSAWSAAHPQVKLGTFAEAAAHGETLFNATSGLVSVAVLEQAGAASLDGKVLVDISNPLDFSHGMPPILAVSNTDSTGEQLQRAFPGLKVVKSLNTVSAPVMVNPGLVGNGDHTIFVCGNDAAAKAHVTEILTDWFGWRDVVDLGDISTARGTEMYLPLWLRLWMGLGTPMLNVKVMR